MDCLIEVVRETQLHIVRVSGRLTQDHVPDLLSATNVAAGSVRLDLANLVSADSIGLAALRRVRASGATVVNAPRFIQLLLDSLPGDPGT